MRVCEDHRTVEAFHGKTPTLFLAELIILPNSKSKDELIILSNSKNKDELIILPNSKNKDELIILTNSKNKDELIILTNSFHQTWHQNFQFQNLDVFTFLPCE